MADRRSHHRRVDVVAPGQKPVAGPLEHAEVAGLLRHLGHELDRRGAGPDHRDARAAQVIVVIPARRVKAVAAKAIQTRESRD